MTDKASQEAHIRGTKSCIDIVNFGYTNMDLLKSKLHGELSAATDLYPGRRFSSQRLEREAYERAVNNALEIVISLETRFITGGSRDFKSKTVFSYSSVDDIFGDV